MAIKVSSSTVINNSLGLENIASLDSTTIDTIAGALGLMKVDAVIVAGGAAGETNRAGGGGAGGVIQKSDIYIGNTTIVIGAGGFAGTVSTGATSGSNTSAGLMGIAVGGGKGANSTLVAVIGPRGSSGGVFVIASSTRPCSSSTIVPCCYCCFLQFDVSEESESLIRCYLGKGLLHRLDLGVIRRDTIAHQTIGNRQFFNNADLNVGTGFSQRLGHKTARWARANNRYFTRHFYPTLGLTQMG